MVVKNVKKVIFLIILDIIYIKFKKLLFIKAIDIWFKILYYNSKPNVNVLKYIKYIQHVYNTD